MVPNGKDITCSTIIPGRLVKLGFGIDYRQLALCTEEAPGFEHALQRTHSAMGIVA